MFEHLIKEFLRLKGQPVRIFTDDGRVHRGIVLSVVDSAVRILQENGCVTLIEFAHIDAVEEPQMELCRCDHDECEKGRSRRI